ncbi:MAG: hypothetical protein KAJ35_09945, partial [Thermoplasmata archaeon]|nr:hypothetical protein [Thermoplasmata archaeon]
QFGGNLTVRASKFNNTNGSCIYTYRGNISLEDNLLKGYHYDGVHVYGNGSFKALNNTINGTNGSGPITNQVGIEVEEHHGGLVVIEGFDISSCYSGLSLRNSVNVTASEGAINDCYNGIDGNTNRDIEVRDIVLSVCYYGMYLSGTNILRTYDLTITDCTYGLYHWSASDWDGRGLDIIDCDVGLFISGIDFIVGRDLAITDCRLGMQIWGCDKADIGHFNISGSGTGVLVNGGSEIAFRAFKIVGCDDPMNITFTGVSFHDGIIESSRSKMYVTYSRVDCYNVTIGLAEVELGRGYSLSVVSLYFYLGAQVSWQSGHPAPYAQVMITNKTEGTLLTTMADGNGTVSQTLVMQGQVVGDGRSPARYTNNTRLDALIAAGGLTSDVNAVTFTGNTILDLVIADRSRPQLSIATPTPHHIQREKVLLVSGLASDLGSGIERVQVSVDGENWHIADGLGLWTVTLTLDEGVYDILVEAYDLINKATRVVEDITIDTSPPLLTVMAPQSGHSQDTSTLLVHGTAQDLASGLEWVKASINGTSWTLAQGQGTWNLTLEVPDGVHDLQVMAADQLGLTTLVMVMGVLVDTTDPVAYTGPDLETDQGHPVVLDGTRSHDNIGISNWTWRFEYDGENRT